VIFPAVHLAFTRIKIQGAGPVIFHALTAIWVLPSLFLEVGKMGMIAFYAGLFIGILLGFLLSSLLAFFLARGQTEGTPDQTEGYSQPDPLEP
jgi:hypothetical protein